MNDWVRRGTEPRRNIAGVDKEQGRTLKEKNLRNTLYTLKGKNAVQNSLHGY